MITLAVVIGVLAFAYGIETFLIERSLRQPQNPNFTNLNN